jgi:hypothetical protein
MMLTEKKFSTRRFGVELEVGNEVSQDCILDYISTISPRQVEVTDWGQSVNNGYWHIKEDRTCGIDSTGRVTYGVEIASFVASGIHDLVEIVNIADFLYSKGVKVNDNCGFHIHVDISDFTPEQVGVMMARWAKIEFLMTNIVPTRRVNNKFCKMLTKSHRYKASSSYTDAEFWRLMKPVNLHLQSFFHRYRRTTLNLVNYAMAVEHQSAGGDMSHVRKTVELRLPEGTLDSEDIANWVKVFVTFVDSSMGSSMPYNLRSISSLHKFLEYLGLEPNNAQLSAGLQKAKEWVLQRMSLFGKEKWRKKASKLLKKI